jgi:hypothetical protein
LATSWTAHLPERPRRSYTLPADLEIVYVAEGALELRIRDDLHLLQPASR